MRALEQVIGEQATNNEKRKERPRAVKRILREGDLLLINEYLLLGGFEISEKEKRGRKVKERKMGMPDYYELLPLVLRFYGDGKERHITLVYGYIGQELGLTQEELNQHCRDEKHTAIGNIVGQAVRRLKKYDVIESPRRGHYKITQKGIDFLKSKPTEVNDKTLSEFQEFRSFGSVRKEKPAKMQRFSDSGASVPERTIETAFGAIKESLRDELLRRIMGGEPSFFERLVLDLLKKMGYGGSVKDAATAIGRTGDEGIDGVIKEDVLGLYAIYVQAKRWENVIGRPEIQKFAGALHGRKAKKGIFITTSGFSREAVEYAADIDIKIVLVDGQKLTDLMIEHNVGVSAVNSYEIKRIDEEYFYN